MRWVNSFGEAPGKIWRQLFDSLTDAQIHRGIIHFAKEDREHPPTMGAFRGVCLLHTPAQAQVRDALDDMSDYATGANRVMYAIVMGKHGVSKNKLNRMLAEKKRLVNDFELLAQEEEKPNWEKFIATIDQRLRYVMDHKH